MVVRRSEIVGPAICQGRGHAVGVTVLGEVDLNDVTGLRRALRAATESGMDVVVDLMRVTSIDSATLALLAGTARRIQRRGARLRVACRDANIRRILEMTLLDRLLDIHASRAAALDPPWRGT